MIGDKTKYNVCHKYEQATNNVLRSYINGVQGDFALLIY